MTSEDKLPVGREGNLEDYLEDEGFVCPGCGCTFTHQLATAVFSRAGEYEPTVRTIVPARTKPDVWGDEDAKKWNPSCPSPRRDGTLLLMKCEDYGCLSEIGIYQHQGRTYASVKNLGAEKTLS